MTDTPAWADGTVLRVCRPELFVTCDWPGCSRDASYEIEFSVDGHWEAHRLCPTHQEVIGVDVGEGTRS